MKELKGKRLGVLIALCGLIASSVGILTNVAGLFFAPAAEELGVGRGSVSLSLTICNLAFAAGGMLSLRVVAGGRFKTAVCAGTLIMAGATAALSLAQSVTMLYLFNALRGFIAGMLGFVLVTTVINRWFTQGVGLVTSIALGCSGLAGAALSPVVSAVIESAGWRKGYLFCAALILLLNLPAILIPFGMDPEDKSDGPTATYRKDAGAGVSGLVFAAVAFFSACAAFIGAMPQHFPGLASSYALPAAQGAAMLSVCMVANTGSKLLFGILSDKIGARRSLLLFCALVAAALLLLIFIRAAAPLLIAAALLGCTYALATVGVVMLTKDAFSRAQYEKVFPSISMAGTLANAAASSLIGFLYDGSGAYTGALALLLALCALQAGAVFAAYRNKTVH